MRCERVADKCRIIVSDRYTVSDPVGTATVTSPYIFPTRSLLEARLVILLDAWPYVLGGAFEDARAGIPAQNGLVVSRRS